MAVDLFAMLHAQAAGRDVKQVTRNLQPTQFGESLAHLPDGHPLKPNAAGTVQLPMFMSADEIKQSHQPLGGDKQGRLDALWDRYGDDSQKGYSAPIPGWSADQERETSDQLWSRKAAEAEASGLAESVQRKGVTFPVHLGMTPVQQPDEQRIQPEIVGGHHRIAASDPHRLMPVLFHDRRDIPPGSKNMWGTGPAADTDISAARNSRGYRYR